MKPQLLAAGALIVFAAPALADNVTITVTGTLTSYATSTAVDYTGRFGPAGASLSGDTFRVVYSINIPCDGCDRTIHPGAGGSGEISGGSLYGTASPFTSAALTINGITVPIGTATYGVDQFFNSSGGFPETIGGHYINSFALQSTNSYSNTGTYSQINTEFDSGVFKIPASLLTPYSVTFDPSTDFHLSGNNNLDGAVRFMDNGVATFASALVVSTMALDNPYAVPGPVAGAGLPGLGLLFAGLLMWCRERRT